MKRPPAKSGAAPAPPASTAAREPGKPPRRMQQVAGDVPAVAPIKAGGLRAPSASELAYDPEAPKGATAREAELVADLLADEANGDRAREAYQAIEEVRSAAGEGAGTRLTPELVALLVGGTTTTRGGSLGTAGLLGSSQAAEAAQALVGVDDDIYAQITAMLADAGSDTERVLILESVSARRDMLLHPEADRSEVTRDPFLYGIDGAVARDPMAELAAFADAIRGRQDLLRATTLFDLDGGAGPAQHYTRSCAAMTAIYAYAEIDPALALMLREHPERIAELEAGVLDYFGEPIEERPGSGRGDGLTAVDAYNRLGLDRALNVEPTAAEQTFNVRSVSAAHPDHWERVDVALARGQPVPMRTDAFPDPATGAGGHYVIATDVWVDGASTRYLVTDPWTGRTAWVTREQLADGSLPDVFGPELDAPLLDSYVEPAG